MTDDFYRAPGQPEDPDSDYIVHATARNGELRAVAIRSTNLVQKVMELHGTSPVATAALGRFLSGSLLLASSIKADDTSQTSILRCDGPLRGMTAVCNNKGEVRGYANVPVVENFYKRPGKLDVSAAVGKGSLTIIKDMGSKEPYSGTVELISGEIAEDFTYYLAASEQIPSVVSLGVLLENGAVAAAGGFLVQLMPDASEETISYLEKRAGGGFPDISFLVREGLNPEQILDMFLGDPEICYLQAASVAFACTCSHSKMEANLVALGKKELGDLANDEKGIELHCHFCNRKYMFSQGEVISILKKSNNIHI